MSGLLAKVLTFIGENMPLFEALIAAIESGADKASILKAIEASMVSASDAAMRAELTK